MRCLSGSFLFLAVVLSAVGCAGQAKVGGTIQLDGKPLADAGIEFWPTEEMTGTFSSKTDSEGRYRLMSRDGEWVKPGRYTVTVTKLVNKQGKVVDFKNNPSDREYFFIPGALRNILPPVYGDPNKSPLNAEVKPGDNDIPFELKSRP